jgi:hypothetical protein
MRYAIVRAIHSPTAGDIRSARLVLGDVPDKTTVAEVAQSLIEAGRAAEFSEAGVEFGNHEIIAEGRAGWRKGVEGLGDAPVLTWHRLITPPLASDGKRVTLRLTPAEHQRVSMAAERAGLSLQSWCMARLLPAAPVPAAVVAAAAASDAADARVRDMAAALAAESDAADARARDMAAAEMHSH